MRNVMVTGGTRGLGLAIARKLCAGGYRVIAVARREGEAFASALREDAKIDRDALHFCTFDLGDTASIAALVRRIRKEFGVIYGLVNNAAIGTSGVLATMRDRDLETIVRLNTLSPLILTKYVVRSMMAADGGRIVNIGSIAGMTGFGGLAAYSATKASLLGLTRSLAREVGPAGITVNAVAPGFLATEMTADLTDAQRQRIIRRSALRRLPEPADVAAAVEFLLSEQARNITGTTLTVDAGNTA